MHLIGANMKEAHYVHWGYRKNETKGENLMYSAGKLWDITVIEKPQAFYSREINRLWKEDYSGPAVCSLELMYGKSSSPLHLHPGGVNTKLMLTTQGFEFSWLMSEKLRLVAEKSGIVIQGGWCAALPLACLLLLCYKTSLSSFFSSFLRSI